MSNGRRRGSAGFAAFVVLCFFTTLGASAQTAWTPARFGEVVTGRSKAKDVIREFGPAEPAKGKKLITYTYPGKGDFGGDLVIEISRATGLVETVTSRPSQNITRTEAYRKFGKDYLEITYSAAKCGEGTNPPVYRDKNGPIELLEYPKQGIILWPNAYGFDIAAILYRAKPLPFTKPDCPK